MRAVCTYSCAHKHTHTHACARAHTHTHTHNIHHAVQWVRGPRAHTHNTHNTQHTHVVQQVRANKDRARSLEMLSQMGFARTPQMDSLLQQYPNDLDTVITALIERGGGASRGGGEGQRGGDPGGALAAEFARLDLLGKGALLSTKQRTMLKATSFALRPYGVLGTRLGLAGITQEAPGPTAKLCAFCDPAGLRYIQEYGPQGAGGASGSIYAWLGISEQYAFPSDVVNAIVKETDAKAFVYDVHGKGRAICIHVVGPQFGRSRATNEGYAAAVETLSVAYENVLKEFSACDAPALRLLPISGGIFAGPFLDKIALLTIDSLGRACERIQAADPPMATLLGAKQLDMCVFSEKEWELFQAAWSR